MGFWVLHQLLGAHLPTVRFPLGGWFSALSASSPNSILVMANPSPFCKNIVKTTNLYLLHLFNFPYFCYDL